jgi:hypothetical protein
MVDRRLAAYRRVHLGQQCRGHLHKRHTAHVAGRGKAGHVADHAAAQGKQHRLAVAAVFQQGVKNQLQGGPVLVDFAIRQGDQQHLAIALAQSLGKLRGIKRRHRGV